MDLITYCFLLSFAISNGILTQLMDVITAYLNGDLEEEIYTTPPDGVMEYLGIDPSRFNKCALRTLKSLYGLKQSGRNWYKTIQTYLIDLVFVNKPMCP